MASNNYTSANVVPAADTFREWVDLTNRITYDMEKVVVTVAANTQGARTSGNASVNGYFSANTLIVEQEMRGAKATGTIYGTKAASANLVIVSNTVFKANATHASIIHAQANVHHTGALFEASSNVNINSTSTTFTSNAGTNIFNTPVDVNANMDVDNSLTHITSTLTDIDGGNLNVNSNTVIDANTTQLKGGTVTSSSNVNINSTATTFTSNAGTNIFNTPMDINANIDADNASIHLTSTLTDIDGGDLNVNSNTVIDANTVVLAGGSVLSSSNVSISSTASYFQSAATLNVFDSPMDINANMDIDNTLTDFTSTTFNLSGTTALVDSTTMNIHGTSLDINSATNIDGTLTTTNTNWLKGANTTIGDANTDVFNVNSNAILNDKLNVKKNVDLDANLNVDGATTLNGQVTLGNATSDDLLFSGYAATGITPKASGTLSLGTSSLRWDGFLDDTTTAELTVDNNATVGNDLTVDNQFNVNTAITYTQDATNDTLVLGKGTTSNSRVSIKGRVNHNLVPFANTVLLGNTSNRWVLSAVSGNFSTTLDVAGITNLNNTTESSSSTTGALIVDGGVGIAKKVFLGSELTGSGLATFNNGLVVSGISNVATFNASGASILTGLVTAQDSINVSDSVTVGGRVDVDSTQQSTSITTGALVVDGGAGIAKNVWAGGSLNVTGLSSLDGGIDVNGVATIGTNGAIDTDGSLYVKGSTTLGDATSDTVKFIGSIAGNSTVGIIPSANGRILGTTLKRFAGMFTTINTSSDITAGGDVDVAGEANTSTLLVNTTSSFKGNSTWSRTGTTGDLTITANTTQHNMGIGGIVCANLVVSGTATLPSDTSLTLSTVSGKVFNVADTINLGTGANAVTQVIFGSGAGSGTTANVIFTNAVFSSTFVPRLDNTIDIGTSSKGFRTGYFDTLVKVGNTEANTTSIITDNVYARNDLIGNYSSDHRLKDNVLVIDSALTKVNEIGGYSFTWNNKIGDHREGTNDYGVIAQEIENILPDAVSINSQGNKTVNYNALIPLLVEAVKELSAKVDYYMQADIEGDKE